MLQSHLHLRVDLTRRTSGRRMGTLNSNALSEIELHCKRKYFHSEQNIFRFFFLKKYLYINVFDSSNHRSGTVQQTLIYTLRYKTSVVQATRQSLRSLQPEPNGSKKSRGIRYWKIFLGAFAQLRKAITSVTSDLLPVCPSVCHHASVRLSLDRHL